MYYIYVVTNRPYGTLYIGVTHDLVRRVWEHKQKAVQGFTEKYKLDKLVYYESCEDRIRAIEREKQLKRWHRDWKIDLIQTNNPTWKDLYKDVCQK